MFTLHPSISQLQSIIFGYVDGLFSPSLNIDVARSYCVPKLAAWGLLSLLFSVLVNSPLHHNPTVGSHGSAFFQSHISLNRGQANIFCALWGERRARIIDPSSDQLGEAHTKLSDLDIYQRQNSNLENISSGLSWLGLTAENLTACAHWSVSKADACNNI